MRRYAVFECRIIGRNLSRDRCLQMKTNDGLCIRSLRKPIRKTGTNWVLEIRPGTGRTSLTAEAAINVDRIAEAIVKFECFKKQKHVIQVPSV